MPKLQPAAELDAVQRLIEGEGRAMGLDAIFNALVPRIPRRNLQRRLAHLVAEGRLTAEGRGRGTRYGPAPGIEARAVTGPRTPGISSMVAMHRAELVALCSRHHVRTLDLFGSAATGSDGPGSDLDFLVDFESMAKGYADNYFGLLESLKRLFDRPVDLVVAAAIRNPYFRQSVEKTRRLLYAA